MSICTCERCDRFIDSDDEPHCFVDMPDGSTEVICDNCQEQAYDLQQERLMEDGPGPSLLDQQIEAMKFK